MHKNVVLKDAKEFKKTAVPYLCYKLKDTWQVSNLTQMKSNQADLFDQTSPIWECQLYFAGSQWQLTLEVEHQVWSGLASLVDTLPNAQLNALLLTGAPQSEQFFSLCEMWPEE
jgi:hypothetical protein